MEIIEKLEAHKRETFDDARRLKRDHDEGAIIYGNPVGAFVVRDQFISTTCSGCLKTYGCKTQSQTQLQRCSKCKFVRYCSVECGVSNCLQKIIRFELLSFFSCRPRIGKDVTKRNVECWKLFGNPARIKTPVLLVFLSGITCYSSWVFLINLINHHVTNNIHWKKPVVQIPG